MGAKFVFRKQNFLSWFRCWCFELFSWCFFSACVCFILLPIWRLSFFLILKSLSNRCAEGGFSFFPGSMLTHTHRESYQKFFLHLRHLLPRLFPSLFAHSIRIRQAHVTHNDAKWALSKQITWFKSCLRFSSAAAFFQLMHKNCDKSILEKKRKNGGFSWSRWVVRVFL